MFPEAHVLRRPCQHKRFSVLPLQVHPFSLIDFQSGPLDNGRAFREKECVLWANQGCVSPLAEEFDDAQQPERSSEGRAKLSQASQMDVGGIGACP